MTGVPPNFEQPETVPRRKKGWEPLPESRVTVSLLCRLQGVSKIHVPIYPSNN